MITDITGSIGGLTFQSNRSGKIVRLRGGPRRVSTSKQTLAHQTHIKFLQLFQQLSLTNKTDWDDFASLNTKINRFGTVKTLTGQNWFESINQNRDKFGLSVLTSPPTHVLPVAVQDYTLTVNQTKIEIVFSPAFNPTDNGIMILTTYPFTRITNSFRTALRLTKLIPSPPYTTINITADWKSTHSLPYPPSSNVNCYTIGVMVQTINKNSGIASTGLIKVDDTFLSAFGIGTMTIGTTFIVS